MCVPAVFSHVYVCMSVSMCSCAYLLAFALQFYWLKVIPLLCQVEMVHGKRLNAQKFSIGGTPRKVLYHNESRTLLVLRTGLSGASCSSDIVQVDPQNGVLLSRYKCEPGETAKCMQITKIGSDQVLVVGISRSAGRPMMSNGEAERFTPDLLFLIN